RSIVRIGFPQGFYGRETTLNSRGSDGAKVVVPGGGLRARARRRDGGGRRGLPGYAAGPGGRRRASRRYAGRAALVGGGRWERARARGDACRARRDRHALRGGDDVQRASRRVRAIGCPWSWSL